jgi:hypothetical protein
MVNEIDSGSRFIYKNKIGPEAKNPHEIFKWLTATQKIIERSQSEREGSSKLKGYLERVKKAFHKKYIPKLENFPREEFISFQSRAAEVLGHGRITSLPEEAYETEIQTQKESLDEWIEYFTSADSSSFPVWAKYWAFHGVVRMSGIQKLDPETMTVSFPKREKNTFGRFPELNREALAKAVEHIVTKVETGINLNEALKQESFRDVYTFYINKLRAETTINELEVTDGSWIKYRQRNEEDLDNLVNSLEGKNTGWCTAVRSTAQSQLAQGDFYVYYSRSSSGKPNPRIAIRMEGKKIAEIRGIGANQNFDSVISSTNILDSKLDEFGNEGVKYKKRNSDMKRLTDIDKRFNKGEELTIDDLRFLYEFESKIEGFGYSKDPRIKEIISKRNIREDISISTGYKPNEISINKEEAISGEIKYHYGDLDLSSLTSAEGLVLPQSVGGDLDLRKLTSAEGLTLPQSVGRDLYLGALTSAEGLTLPQSVGRSLDLGALTSAEGLTLPQSVRGSLNLRKLTSAEGLTLPQSVGGNLDLRNLNSAEGLTLPQSVGGNLYLDVLTSAEGLTLPQSVGMSLNLPFLTSAEGLVLPQSVGESLYLSGLTSAEGLTLPQSIGGSLNLRNLTSAEGLNLPQSVGGYVYLRNMLDSYRKLKIKYPDIKFSFK